MRIVQETPAKVNLFLRMDGKREDGYHLLFSAMQTIAIYDTIKVEVQPSMDIRRPDILFTSNCPFLTNDPKKNTAVKAAKLFLETMDECYQISIELDKRIPSQAGLGGGSSDGAAVLLALDELFPGRVSEEQLLSMATRIGADVPFFLKKGTMLCEGVGEIMTDLPDFSHIPMLILKPNAGVSTPRCYAKFDELNLPTISTNEKFAIIQSIQQEINVPTAIDRARYCSPLWKNDLQIPAMTEVPCMQEGLDLMERSGAFFSSMSGSGSALFGLFEKEEQIDQLLSSHSISVLREAGWWVCKTMTTSC